MFNMVQAADESDNKLDFDWPRLTWIFVFQFPVVNAISTIITEATEVTGTYCNGNFSPKFGYIVSKQMGKTVTRPRGCLVVFHPARENLFYV